MRNILYPFFIARLAISLAAFSLRVAIALTPMYIWVLSLIVLVSMQSGIWWKISTSKPTEPQAISQDTNQNLLQSKYFYREVLQLQPTHRDAIINLSSILRDEGDITNADRLLEQAELLDPLYFQK